MILLRSAAIAIAFLAASTDARAQDQEQMKKNLEKKLESEFLKNATWITDHDEAKAAAKKTNRLIFAYFTRSYARWGPCETLEGGSLSEKGFAEFAKEVVLFLHITTHIEGRKDDKLFREVGGRGFPHLVAMDVEGKVVANLEGDRTAEGFRAMMKQGGEFVDLRTKADKGDSTAQVEYFIRALNINIFKLDAARKYQAGLKKVTADQKKTIDSLVAGLEVQDMLEPLYSIKDRTKGKEMQIDLGRKFWQMHEQGRVPGQDDLVSTFYSLTLLFAETDKNIAAFEKSLDALKAHFGDKIRRDFVRAKEEILEKMKAEKEEKKEEPKNN